MYHDCAALDILTVLGGRNVEIQFALLLMREGVSPVTVAIMRGKTKGLSWNCDNLFTAVSIIILFILCELQLYILVP